jgi:hypothetical protein
MSHLLMGQPCAWDQLWVGSVWSTVAGDFGHYICSCCSFSMKGWAHIHPSVEIDTSELFRVFT